MAQENFESRYDSDVACATKLGHLLAFIGAH